MLVDGKESRAYTLKGQNCINSSAAQYASSSTARILVYIEDARGPHRSILHDIALQGEVTYQWHPITKERQRKREREPQSSRTTCAVVQQRTGA